MAMKNLGDIAPAASIELDLDEMVTRIGKEVDCLPIELHSGSRVPHTLSSGSLVWDLIVGGGYGKGKWTTVFGPEGSGKSTAVYHAIAEAIRNRGMRVLHFAHEASDDPIYMRAIGVPIGDPAFCDPITGRSKFYRYYQPETGEQTFRLIYNLLNELPDSPGAAPPAILIVIDSLAAMMSELEEEDKHPMALQARMFSTYLRMIKGKLSRKGCIVLAVNQLRMDPNAMGNPEMEPGGQAVRFYPDMKIRVNMIGGMGEKNTVIEGRHQYRSIKTRTTKNKQYPPFQFCDEMRIRLGYGFDPLSDGLQYLKLTGQVTTAGAWYKPDPKLEIANFQWKNSQVLESAEFRQKMRAQLLTGEAFERYFAARNLDSSWSTTMADIAVEAAADEKAVEPAAPEVPPGAPTDPNTSVTTL
jgi:protein RecA